MASWGHFASRRITARKSTKQSGKRGRGHRVSDATLTHTLKNSVQLFSRQEQKQRQPGAGNHALRESSLTVNPFPASGLIPRHSSPVDTGTVTDLQDPRLIYLRVCFIRYEDEPFSVLPSRRFSSGLPEPVSTTGGLELPDSYFQVKDTSSRAFVCIQTHTSQSRSFPSIVFVFNCLFFPLFS